MKWEQLVVIAGVITAAATIATVIFSYKVYRRDQINTKNDFDSIIVQFKGIAENLEKQDQARNAQFTTSLNRLDGITSSVKAAEERSYRDLKVRLGTSVRRIISIMKFWDKQLNAESDENRLQLIANAVELGNILEQEMVNPHLKNDKQVYEQWSIFCGVLQSLRGKKEGNYQFKYKEVFDTILGAFSEFRTFSAVIDADLEGNLIKL